MAAAAGSREAETGHGNRVVTTIDSLSPRGPHARFMIRFELEDDVDDDLDEDDDESEDDEDAEDDDEDADTETWQVSLAG